MNKKIYPTFLLEAIRYKNDLSEYYDMLIHVFPIPHGEIEDCGYKLDQAIKSLKVAQKCYSEISDCCPLCKGKIGVDKEGNMRCEACQTKIDVELENIPF